MMSQAELWRLVQALPNGCALRHLTDGPEDDDTAWQVLSWAGPVLASGPTLEICMERWAARQRSMTLFPEQEDDLAPPFQ